MRDERPFEKGMVVPTSGGTVCDDDSCPYTRDCANHITAGMHREEGGFTPKLRVLDGNKAECWGPHPEDHIGFLSFKDGKYAG